MQTPHRRVDRRPALRRRHDQQEPAASGADNLAAIRARERSPISSCRTTRDGSLRIGIARLCCVLDPTSRRYRQATFAPPVNRIMPKSRAAPVLRDRTRNVRILVEIPLFVKFNLALCRRVPIRLRRTGWSPLHRLRLERLRRDVIGHLTTQRGPDGNGIKRAWRLVGRHRATRRSLTG